jgi:hypothetical protein
MYKGKELVAVAEAVAVMKNLLPLCTATATLLY